MREAYQARRREVLTKLGPSVMVLFSTPVAFRNNDVEHEFRQDSDLFYLSGFDEPDCALLLDGTSENPFTLYVRPRDPKREAWDGPRAGVEGAREVWNADEAHPIAELPEQLAERLKGKSHLYHAFGRNRSADELVITALSRARQGTRRTGIAPTNLVDPSTILHEMRLVKAAEEIRAIEQAISVTAKGYELILRYARPGMAEYELEAILKSEFRRQGSERCAYPPIVAAGNNATVLHHSRNDGRLEEGALILVDAGAELRYYASDISRTFPCSGSFRPLQRRAYEIVLRAQQRAISGVAPGATLDEIHCRAVEELSLGLIELGILSESLPTVVEKELYKKYYPHRTSHWLGMDVHDVGAYASKDGARRLEPGMVLTVEPGLYFPCDDPATPSELRGTGIRIEDDVLVMIGGRRNLSSEIPSSVEAVEALCNKG